MMKQFLQLVCNMESDSIQIVLLQLLNPRLIQTGQKWKNGQISKFELTSDEAGADADQIIQAPSISSSGICELIGKRTKKHTFFIIQKLLAKFAIMKRIHKA
jgi:hypothetical protein